MTVINCTLKSALIAWRVYAMSKKTMNVAKTVGIGLMAGTAAMAVGTMVMKNQAAKHPKRKANKAIHRVGEIIGSVESMLS